MRDKTVLASYWLLFILGPALIVYLYIGPSEKGWTWGASTFFVLLLIGERGFRIWKRIFPGRILNFDGIDLKYLVNDFEKTWPVKMDGITWSNEVTVFEVAQAIAERAHVPVDDVMPRLIKMIADFMSLDSAKVLPSSRFIKDLGMK